MIDVRIAVGAAAFDVFDSLPFALCVLVAEIAVCAAGSLVVDDAVFSRAIGVPSV